MNTFLNGLRSIATASIAGSLLAASSFFAVEALLPKEAMAGYTCRDSWGDRRICETDSGDTYTIRPSWGDRTIIDGPNGSVTCRESWGNRTVCD